MVKMKYYTNQKDKIKRKILLRFLCCIIIVAVIIYFISYIFDKRIYNGVLEISKTAVTARTTDIVNEESTNLFSEKYKYSDLVIISRDKDNNINLIQVNTAQLNSFTADLSAGTNKKLADIGKIPIDVPLGWITDNTAFYNLGPKMSVKVVPVGNINVSYESKFEEAGINQTRHKIYLNVEANVKIVMPFHSEQLTVDSQIPISETIIIGKIPQTAVDFGKNNSN